MKYVAALIHLYMHYQLAGEQGLKNNNRDQQCLDEGQYVETASRMKFSSI